MLLVLAMAPTQWTFILQGLTIHPVEPVLGVVALLWLIRWVIVRGSMPLPPFSHWALVLVTALGLCAVNWEQAGPVVREVAKLVLYLLIAVTLFRTTLTSPARIRLVVGILLLTTTCAVGVACWQRYTLPHQMEVERPYYSTWFPRAILRAYTRIPTPVHVCSTFGSWAKIHFFYPSRTAYAAFLALVFPFALAFGLASPSRWGVSALIIGFLGGALVKLLIHLWGLRRHWQEYLPVIDWRHPGVRRFGILAAPLLIGVIGSIVRQSVDLRLVSSLPTGHLSAFLYADTLCNIPVHFFAVMLGIVLFPFLTDFAAAGDRARLQQLLGIATRVMVLLFLPLALLLALWRHQVVWAVLGSGRFDAAFVHLTSVPLLVFAIGMLGEALNLLVLRFWHALSEMWRPMVIGLALVPIHITIAHTGIHYFGWGISALAFAAVITQSLKLVVLYSFLRARMDSLEGRKLMSMLGKQGVALAPFLIVIWAAREYWPLPTDLDATAKWGYLLPYLEPVPKSPFF